MKEFDFDKSGVITLTYDLDSGSLQALHYDNVVAAANNDPGNSGNPIP